MNIIPHQVTADQLLLDPNNYRFHDLDGYKRVNPKRYGEDGVQLKARSFLLNTPSFELEALRDSIITNGFVPFEQIVVEHFDGEGKNARYLVIEGNRRTAAIKTILDDVRDGALDLTDRILSTLQEFSVIEVTGSDAEKADYQKTLMAIRHVAGIREWGPYQQARLIVELYDADQSNKSFAPIAKKIGIRPQEVARRYRASKALAQMEDDDEFGSLATPKLYVYFHEAMSQPKVREWLKFSDQDYAAHDDDARRTFYELITPRDIDGVKKPPKITSALTQIRQLKNIVDKPIPLSILGDPERPFEDAVSAAEAETTISQSGQLEHAISVALHSLKQPGVDAWLDPSDEAKATWAELVQLVEKLKTFPSLR